METQEIITSIIDGYAPQAGRARVLDLLDKVQKNIFGGNAVQNIFLNFDDPDFPIPVLSTTANNLDYDITAANLVDSEQNAITLTVGGRAVVARRIKRVFIQASSIGSTNYNKTFYGERFDWAGLNDFWSQRLSRIQFFEVPVILFHRSGLRNAHVTFVEDPGTENNKYFVEFYYGPVELTSETVPLSIDGDTFYKELVDGVVGLIEDSDFGRSDRWTTFTQVHKPKIIGSLNAGVAHKKPLKMTSREFG